MPPAQFSPCFQSLPHFPGAESQSGGFAYVLRPCGPFKQTLLRDWQFLPPPQLLMVFTARSFHALISWHWNPGLRGLACGWDVSLYGYPSQFLSATRECGTACSASCHCLTATTTPRPPSLPQLPITASPTHLNEYFFSKSLVVRLPYSSIFWQFWLYFVLRLVVILLL